MLDNRIDENMSISNIIVPRRNHSFAGIAVVTLALCSTIFAQVIGLRCMINYRYSCVSGVPGVQYNSQMLAFVGRTDINILPGYTFKWYSVWHGA